MTDQNLAEDVRAIVERMRDHANHDNVRGSEEEYIRYFADRLEALLPTPPTLADMTPEERAACQWMQADVDGEITAGIIAKINPTDAHLLASDGETWFLALETVTPRPDLPRLEWPGDTTVAPDHLAVGTVIESADDPRIDALPVGSILLDRDNDAVTKEGERWAGLGYEPVPDEGDDVGPWKVINIGQEEDQ